MFAMSFTKSTQPPPIRLINLSNSTGTPEINGNYELTNITISRTCDNDNTVTVNFPLYYMFNQSYDLNLYISIAHIYKVTNDTYNVLIGCVAIYPEEDPLYTQIPDYGLFNIGISKQLLTSSTDLIIDCILAYLNGEIHKDIMEDIDDYPENNGTDGMISISTI